MRESYAHNYDHSLEVAKSVSFTFFAASATELTAWTDAIAYEIAKHSVPPLVIGMPMAEKFWKVSENDVGVVPDDIFD